MISARQGPKDTAILILSSIYYIYIEPVHGSRISLPSKKGRHTLTVDPKSCTRHPGAMILQLPLFNLGQSNARRPTHHHTKGTKLNIQSSTTDMFPTRYLLLYTHTTYLSVTEHMPSGILQLRDASAASDELQELIISSFGSRRGGDWGGVGMGVQRIHIFVCG